MFYRYKDQSRQFYEPRIGRSIHGKAVNRGGGIGMEIPCVYIFVSNNPAIRAEDDPGTAHSKHATFKRKKIKGNDWNKKPRK